MTIEIIATGRAIPPARVTNDDLAERIDTSDEWIRSHTGIGARHIAAEDTACSDLALEAAKNALAMAAGLDGPAGDPDRKRALAETALGLDLIVLSTATADYYGCPPTACIVQDKLGAKNAGAMDLGACCTGFIYGLETAAALLSVDRRRKQALVIGSEVLSRVINWNDRGSCVLFGDGTGAVVIEKTTDPPAAPAAPPRTILKADGSGMEHLVFRRGGSRHPFKAGETIDLPIYRGKKYIFLFPGQGAQYPGMALDFLEGSSGGEVRRLFDTASKICGRDMAALLGNTGGEVLKGTGISQPAITLANLAAAAFLADRGFRPAACAGFSLGEYAAMVTAGILNPEDCFRLVKVRGEAMQAAADRIAGKAAGETPGMAAVIGLAPAAALELVARWNAGGLKDLYAANINSPKQIVVSGTAEALAEAERRFREAGARRVIRLRVAGPFHSPLVAEAAEKFSPALEAAAFRDPRIPLYSNVTGRRVGSGEEARNLALAQITSPVRWVEEEERINTGGFDAALECGPGRVLQSLWRDFGSPIPCYSADTVEDVRVLSGLPDKP